jgi:hypothetical protein
MLSFWILFLGFPFLTDYSENRRSIKIMDYYDGQKKDPFTGLSNDIPRDLVFLNEIQAIFDELGDPSLVQDCAVAAASMGKIADKEKENDRKGVSWAVQLALIKAQDHTLETLIETCQNSLKNALKMIQRYRDDTNHHREFKTSQLTKIIKLALRNENISIAMEAAVLRGYYGSYPYGTTWDDILKKYLKVKEKVNDLSFEMIELKPYRFPVGEGSVLKIIEILRAHHWNLPGFEVKFNAYGNEREKSYYYKIESIRGPSFFLEFGMIQHRIATLNDTAGLDSVIIPKLAGSFYADDSGPSVYVYNGSSWDEDKEDLLNSLTLWGDKRWSKKSIYIPGRNEIQLEDIFDSAKDIAVRRNQKQKTGISLRSELESRLNEYLEQHALTEAIAAAESLSMEKAPSF